VIYSDLINSLELLINALNKSNKKQSAVFFSAKLNEIKKGENNLKPILDELSKCRAMAQYAGFSFLEEKLLDNVVGNATKMIKNKP